MNKLLIAGLCLLGGFAIAQEAAEEEETVGEMQIILSTMEQIDVTSEKPLVEDTEELDGDIESILEEAEAVEEES